MCLPLAAAAAIASAVVAAGGQVYSGMAANSQGKYEQQVANQNAGIERNAAADAAQRGEVAQMRQWRQVAQQYGEQNARQSASGLDTSFGSPAALLGDVTQIGYEDSQILAQNTEKEIKGYDINAANYVNQGNAARARGKAALIGSGISAFSTILGGASQASKIAGASATASAG